MVLISQKAKTKLIDAFLGSGIVSPSFWSDTSNFPVSSHFPKMTLRYTILESLPFHDAYAHAEHSQISDLTGRDSTKQQNMLLPFVCGNATEQKPVKFETIHTPPTICFRRLLWTNKKYLRISLLVWAINWQPIKASKSPNSTQSKAHLFQISEICVVNPPAEETSFDDGSKVVSNGVSRPNYDDSKPSNGNELICLDEAEAAAEQLDGFTLDDLNDEVAIVLQEFKLLFS